jgi:hypothetical protein
MTMPGTLMSTHRRDWFRILGELNAAGQTNARVARRLGVAKNSIYCWKMGGDPSHALGVALLEMHAKYCKVAEASVAPSNVARKRKAANKGALKEKGKGEGSEEMRYL